MFRLSKIDGPEGLGTGFGLGFPTRVTYGAVFARYRGCLEPYGIDTVDKFRKVVHCAQSLASARRSSALSK